ncbi:MAG: hypothetical protein EOM19_05515 [Candidatus Moranbacteria bacterium]|nr:hypothetical protein [Candidatus Moranbacteria bacterium]
MTLFLLISGYGFSLFARQVLVNGRIIGKIVISFYVIISLFCYYGMLYFSKTFSLFEILSFIQKESFFGIIYSLVLFWALYGIVKIFVHKQEGVTIKKMKFL